MSWIFLAPNEKRKLNILEKDLKLKIDKVDIPSDGEVLEIRMQKWANALLEAKPIKGVDMLEFEHIKASLSELSQEALIDQLLWQELGAMNYGKSKRRSNDEFDSDRSNDRRKDRTERAERSR